MQCKNILRLKVILLMRNKDTMHGYSTITVLFAHEWIKEKRNAVLDKGN